MADIKGTQTVAPESITSAHDPALNPANQYQHSHIHHSGRVSHANENVHYYKEETVNPATDAQLHHRVKTSHSDIEKGDVKLYNAEERSSGSHEREDKEDPRDNRLGNFYLRFRPWIHLALGVIITGWWIVGLVLHRNDMNWIKPFLFWLAIMLRLITLHVPLAPMVMKTLRFAWDNTGVRIKDLIPEKARTPAAALLVIAVILVGAFASEESADNTRANRAVSLFGIAVFIVVLWATSRNRSKIVWHTVIVGFLVQFIIALFVLRTGVGFDIFDFLSELSRDLLGFAGDGVAFLTEESVVTDIHWFLVTVLPAIIFFVAFVSVLIYWGFMQWFIGKFANFFFWSMRVSGAEAVVASASPFIGQGESVMLVKPFVNHLTSAELHQVMTSGFATIAGSVLIAYVSIGISGQVLISSCVMSIPASLAFSKLRYPEEEEPLTAGRVVIPENTDEEKPVNSLHAFANGAWLGVKIAGMIFATLLCIIAVVGLIDGVLTWWGRYLDLQGEYDLTLELIIGYICYPIAFLLGVSREGDDLIKVARLIGTKIVINEFVAFTNLQKLPEYQTLSTRSRLIATYAVCGFGNIGSLGNQIGMLSQIAPQRAGAVSKLAVSALLTGILSTLSSAAVAGMVITDQAAFAAPPAAA